jgi:hypothetical protein
MHIPPYDSVQCDDQPRPTFSLYLRFDQIPIPPTPLYQILMTPALNDVPAIHDVYHVSVPDRREPMSDGDDRRSVRLGRDPVHGLLDLGLTLVVQCARRLCEEEERPNGEISSAWRID